MTVGQLIGAGVVAVGMPIGYPAFALLYGVSSAIRVVAYREAAPATASESISGHETTTEAGATAVV